VSALGVWLGAERVGLLTEERGRRLTFRYDADWLARPGARVLSLSLPLRPEPFSDDEARPFFANLLPEAGLREAVARRLGLSVGNDFALLEAIGGECAGAVSLLPEGARPDAGGDYDELSEVQLQELIDELPRRPLLAGERGIRLSLAGAQGKLPVKLEGDRVFVPRSGAPSTHILKPEIPGFEGSVRNEAFCMALAARAGLPVPPSRVRPGRHPLYVVERFDRRRAPDGAVERVHQEDLCQALGRLPEVKYEAEGGPSLAECFALVARASVSPAVDRLALLRWVIFNALVQNADAHAKNLSLLHAPDGIRLAPFYDLLCTGAWPDLAEKLAMKIGGEARPGWLRRRHWERFATDVEIAPKLVLKTVRELAESLPGAADAVASDHTRSWGNAPVVDRILAILRGRCAQAEREAG
jgi:serine/threonine-protein kinase HipA